MECQRTQDQAAARARTIRLTDQALVAVTVARRVAGPRGATVADLLAGLATEPDGAAGAVLRRRSTAAGRLAERVRAAIPGLASLEHAAARAADDAAPRPAPTAALLAAALEVGGPDVADLLAACGYEPRELYRAAVGSVAADETFGLGGDVDLAPDAATAVARVRAAAGGAVDLVVAVAALPAPPPLLPADAAELAAVRDDLDRRGDATQAGESWDRGLDAVLDAARGWRRGAPPPVSAQDLLRAALVAGGHGPAALLDEAARRQEQSPR